MNTKIVLIGGVIITAGVGLYLVLRKKAPSSAQSISSSNPAPGVTGLQASIPVNVGALPFNNNYYCNPPVNSTDPERELKKYYYRRKIAEQAWEAQGRGMNLNYFMEQYKKQQGC